MAEQRPYLPRHDDRLVGMFRRTEDRLGDWMWVNGRRIRGFFKIEEGRQISLGSRMNKVTRIPRIKVRECLCRGLKCGDPVIVNNRVYKVAEGSPKRIDCGYLMVHLTDCGKCRKR